MRQQGGMTAQKEGRVVGNQVAPLLGMVHVVHAQANDLARSRHAGRQGDFTERSRLGGLDPIGHTGLQAWLVGALRNEFAQSVRQVGTELAAVNHAIAHPTAPTRGAAGAKAYKTHELSFLKCVKPSLLNLDVEVFDQLPPFADLALDVAAQRRTVHADGFE